MHPHPFTARGLALSLGVALAVGTAAAPAAGAGHGPASTSTKSSKATAKKKTAKHRAAKRKPASHRRSTRAKQLGSGDGYRAWAALPKYAGATGVVLHTRGYTTRFKLSDDPQEEAGYNDETERWQEIGNGHRRHEKTKWFGYDGRLDSTLETWSAPQFSAVLSSGTPASVAIWCTEHSYAGNESELIDRLRTATDLPAGPVISGVATKVLTVTIPVGQEATGTPPTFRYYVNPATGAPVRSTYTPYAASSPLGQTDYSLWEVIPAGGSAQELAGTLPLDADLGQGNGVRPNCIGD